MGETYVEREQELDRLTIGYILEIVQAYLNGSNPNGDDVSCNGPLIEEIYSRIKDFRERREQ